MQMGANEREAQADAPVSGKVDPVERVGSSNGASE
jgi:hypothetical protein